MKTLMVVLGYLFIGGYVGAKVYIKMESDSYSDRVISTMAALGTAALWPLVVLGFIVWTPVKWWIDKLSKGENPNDA